MTGFLLNHLWQSTLFTLGVGVLSLALGKNSAGVRYWLWFAASAKFLVPLSIFMAAGSWIGSYFAKPSPSPALQMLGVIRPFADNVAPLAASTATPIDPTTVLFVVWAIGAIGISGFWLVRWRRLQAIVRTAAPTEILAPMPVFSAPGTIEPGLFGIAQPVLLLPAGIEERLTTEELRAAIAHETFHFYRRDNLTGAFHMLVEVLFWFHPFVWWIGARLVDERERACDEAVIESGNDRETYAQGILKVCKLYLHSPLVCAAGVSGADLRKRMETIMTGEVSRALGGAKRAMLAAAAVTVIAIPFGAGFAGKAALAQALDQAEVARRLGEQAMPRAAIAYNAADFEKYVGFYQKPEGGAVFTVRTDNGHFLTRLTGQVDVEVYPESATKFFAKVVNAQLSFGADAKGTPELVLHQNGREQHFPKISESAAKAYESAIDARVKAGKPDPAREALLRRYIETRTKKDLDLSFMAPRLVQAAQQQQPAVAQIFAKIGAFKSLTFKAVANQGADVDIYVASFENGDLEFRVSPLEDGKLGGLLFRELP